MSRWARIVVVVLMSGFLFSAACTTAPPCSSPQALTAPDSPPAQAMLSSTAALEQKVKAQEKRIADLSMQLKLLKRIELDRSKP